MFPCCVDSISRAQDGDPEVFAVQCEWCGTLCVDSPVEEGWVAL